ncbi:ATP-binding cassette domain-containing protein [Microbacterium invictum]|uniref:Peptide/nickel transport system ATP-binding protein n=1 Tax=Microbacterium invictum TaxID=515415 RepID=A0AA40SMT3_9MICO|nr:MULTISPECIES: ATP-binding cassette domain-containing protein [Microbacterium]MBB4139086.1 peptide/nickel transport system ATP-binding protein [Microbacterium invictum]
MPDAPDVVVRCVDLSISHGGRTPRVVDGVTFTLYRGGALALMGPTGAGKSSLIALLAGADQDVRVAGGTAEVAGIPVQGRGRVGRARRYVTGYLAQRAGADLPARMTVSDVIGDPISSRDRRVNQRALAVRVAGLLDELQLPLGAAHKYPYELSAGMRQRVALARALVLQPRLLVADDVYANLDPEVRTTVHDAIQRRRRDQGLALLMATNDEDAVGGFDADVLVMRDGHTVAYGHGMNDLLWTPDGREKTAP